MKRLWAAAVGSLWALTVATTSVVAERRTADAAVVADEPSHHQAAVVLVYEGGLHDKLLPVALQALDEHFTCTGQWPPVPILVVYNSTLSDKTLKEAVRERQRARPKGCSADITTFRVGPGSEYFARPPHIDPLDVNHHVETTGFAETFRSLSRFWSGPFVDLPFLRDKRWFWRISPDLLLLSQVKESPFAQMAAGNWSYGVCGVKREVTDFVDGLAAAADDFVASSDSDAVRRPRSTLDGDAAFLTAMEVGDLDFFRSFAYQSFFRKADDLGGFHLSRWGDSAFRTVAVDSLLSAGAVGVLDDLDFAFPVKLASSAAAKQSDKASSGTDLSMLAGQLQQRGEENDSPVFAPKHRFAPGEVGDRFSLDAFCRSAHGGRSEVCFDFTKGIKRRKASTKKGPSGESKWAATVQSEAPEDLLKLKGEQLRELMGGGKKAKPK